MIVMTLLAVWFAVAFVFCLALGGAAAYARTGPVEKDTVETPAFAGSHGRFAPVPLEAMSCS